MLRNENLILLSDGLATRTFCYVSDAVTGYVKILVKGNAGESYNIGIESPEINMRKLAQYVAEIGSKEFGYDGKVSFMESSDPAYLTDNPNRRCPDISKARSELDYDPKVSLDEGLLKTIIWYGDNRE